MNQTIQRVIKFSSDYSKLWNQNEGKLIHINLLDNSQRNPDLIEYDTKKTDGTYYPLPSTTLIQLVFLGDKNIPFCTLRRFTRQKYDYYQKSKGLWFKLEVQR